MMNKKWRRVATSLVASSLMLSTLGSMTVYAEAAETSVTAEDILARDFSEHIDITYAGVGCTDGFDYNDPENAYWSWFTDTFNMNWDVTPLTFENWSERLNVWINADDMPDWCVWQFNAGDADNYVDQELVKRLPDDWKEKYPNLAKAAEWCPLNEYFEEKYDGTYFLFRPIFADSFPGETVTLHFTLHMRKDWAEEAGYDLSKNIETGTITISEFWDYCRAVKNAGLCEYPYVNTAHHMGTMWCSISENGQTASFDTPFAKLEDGKYHWQPAEESSGVKEALRSIKQAYDEGLINPEFYTLTDENDYAYFYTTGQAAAIAAEGMATRFDRYNKFTEENLGVSYYDDCVALVLTDDNGVYHNTAELNYWGVNILSPKLSDEKLDRILTLWDYSCTDEGAKRIYFGIPEVDWTYDENGNLVSLLADTEYKNLEGKYVTNYPIASGMFILSDNYQFINPDFTEQARNLVTQLYETRSKVANNHDKVVDYDLLSYSSQAMNQATFDYGMEYANLITQSGDFDEIYDNWVADKMPLIQPVLDELNAAFAE